MATELKPYPAYKDSGVEWLGRVPGHWQVRRLKTLCRRSALYGANVAATSYTTVGVRFLRTTDINDDGQLSSKGVFVPEELVQDYLLADGDLLISRSGTVGRSFLYSQQAHGCCAYAGYLVRFVPATIVLPKYLFLFTKTRAFAGFLRVMAISSTIENVNGEKYANALLPLPPPSEQAAIVRFLNHADRRIRRYIRAKEKLITLLEEQKQALIHEAVTGGIDVRTGRPYPEYRDSGVEWLGSVPSHWEVRQLGRIGRFFKGGGGTKEDEREDGVPCVRYGYLYTHHQFFIIASRACVTPELAEQVYTPIRYGDVLFAGSGETIDEIGKSAVNLIRGSACCGGDVIVFRPSIDTDARFLGYAADCPASARQKASIGRGFTVMHVYSSDLKYMVMSLPPLHEQFAVVRFLDDVTRNIDAIVAAGRRQIEGVSEYRTRLIADVVTGQLDVREAATGLPDLEPPAAEENSVDDLTWQLGAEARADAKAGRPLSDLGASERRETVVAELGAEGRWP